MFYVRFLVYLLLSVPASLSSTWAQTSTAVVSTSPVIAASVATAPRKKAAATPRNSKPSWAELTSIQQQALQPLASQWNMLHESQKHKWLALSKNYAQLPAADQAKIHSRMSEWAALSQRQRDLARLNFAQTQELAKTLTPEQKQEKWQAYQGLPEQEKKKLAASRSKVKSAALVAKPVAAQKLTRIGPSDSKLGAVPTTPPAAPSTTLATPAEGAAPPLPVTAN